MIQTTRMKTWKNILEFFSAWVNDRGEFLLALKVECSSTVVLVTLSPLTHLAHPKFPTAVLFFIVMLAVDTTEDVAGWHRVVQLTVPVVCPKPCPSTVDERHGYWSAQKLPAPVLLLVVMYACHSCEDFWIFTLVTEGSIIDCPVAWPPVITGSYLPYRWTGNGPNPVFTLIAVPAIKARDRMSRGADPGPWIIKRSLLKSNGWCRSNQSCHQNHTPHAWIWRTERGIFTHTQQSD